MSNSIIKQSNQFIFPLVMNENSFDLHSCKHLVGTSSLNFIHFSGCVVVTGCGVNCITLNSKDSVNLFMCLLAIFISSFMKCLFKSLPFWKTKLSFSYWFVGLLYILWIKVLCQIEHIINIFSQSGSCFLLL